MAVIISTNRKNTSEGTSALWTTDTNLIGVLRGYFETAWNETEELRKATSTKVAFNNKLFSKRFILSR
jgi:hypothetical protein